MEEIVEKLDKLSSPNFNKPTDQTPSKYRQTISEIMRKKDEIEGKKDEIERDLIKMNKELEESNGKIAAIEKQFAGRDSDYRALDKKMKAIEKNEQFRETPKETLSSLLRTIGDEEYVKKYLDKFDKKKNLWGNNILIVFYLLECIAKSEDLTKQYKNADKVIKISREMEIAQLIGYYLTEAINRNDIDKNEFTELLGFANTKFKNYQLDDIKTSPKKYSRRKMIVISNVTGNPRIDPITLPVMTKEPDANIDGTIEKKALVKVK